MFQFIASAHIYSDNARSCDFPIFPYAPTTDITQQQQLKESTRTSASTNTININDINSGKLYEKSSSNNPNNKMKPS